MGYSYLDKKAKRKIRAASHRSFDHSPDGVFRNLEAGQKHVSVEKKKAYLLRKTAKWKSKVMREKKCSYCSKPLDLKDATMDHVVPLSRGGKSTMANIVLSCKDCNSDKKYKTAVEWLVFDKPQP